MLASRLLLSMAVLGLASACSPNASAQDPKLDPKSPGASKGQAPKEEGRGGPRGPRPVPKPGPTLLPILPALPALDDASFYAVADVPHGKVEQATYTN